MEALEVTDESVNQRVPAFTSEVVPERKRCRSGTITEGISEIGPLGVVPPDLVGDGVGKFEVLREGTGSNLEIVIRVTPSTDPACRGIIEDRCIGEVGACICELEYQAQPKSTVSRTRQLTQSPVPIRLSSRITAFSPQSELEIGNIGAMPRQEEASEMDLSEEKIRMS